MQYHSSKIYSCVFQSRWSICTSTFKHGMNNTQMKDNIGSTWSVGLSRAREPDMPGTRLEPVRTSLTMLLILRSKCVLAAKADEPTNLDIILIKPCKPIDNIRLCSKRSFQFLNKAWHSCQYHKC